MQDQLDKIVDLIFAVRKVFHKELTTKCCNFSFFQFATLKCIRDKKPLMKDLAAFMVVTPPSATSFIDTLVKSKLVKRVQDPNDRRIVQIVITKKGEEHLKKGKRAIAQGMRGILEGLNKKEQKSLSDILAKVLIEKESK